MYFTVDSPAKYELLREKKHYNILPIYKITQHSIFTKLIEPFATVFDRKKTRYNQYVILKLKEALAFIHEELKLEHNNIVMSGLFVDSNGNILIGKFDRCNEFRNSNDDDYLLNKLSKEMLGKDLNEVSEETNGLFTNLERKETFEGFTLEEKKAFILKVIDNKDQFIDCIKKNIIILFLESITKINEEEYKIFVLESLIKFDRKWYAYEVL